MLEQIVPYSNTCYEQFPFRHKLQSLYRSHPSAHSSLCHIWTERQAVL